MISLFEEICNDLRREIGTDFNKYFGIGDDRIDSYFKGKNVLNLSIIFDDGTVVFNYTNGEYQNRSEYELRDNRKAIQDIRSIVLSWLYDSTLRTDKYIGSKLVSSSLKNKNENTQAILGFRLIGLRKKIKFTYEPPLPRE